MDLVAGVRKEGSRGGRGDFKWEDVQNDAQRENYLGHSLMAPVGRWQKGRDLSWYAKTDKSPAAMSAAEARKEELRKVKEAEQEALNAALGYAPMPKLNANDTPLGKKDVENAMRETIEEADETGAKGVGFGAFAGLQTKAEGEDEETETMKGVGVKDDLQSRQANYERPSQKDSRRRSRSKDRGADRRKNTRVHQTHRRGKSDEDEKDRGSRLYSARSRERSKDRHHHRERRRSNERTDDGRHRHRHRSQRQRSTSPRRSNDHHRPRERGAYYQDH